MLHSLFRTTLKLSATVEIGLNCLLESPHIKWKTLKLNCDIKATVVAYSFDYNVFNFYLKIYNVTTWLTNIYNTHIAQYLTK